MQEKGSTWELSVLPNQFFYKHKTALKNNVQEVLTTAIKQKKRKRYPDGKGRNESVTLCR